MSLEKSLTYPPSNVLGVDEAAAVLKCSKGTIYQWTCHGIIPFYKRGKKLYFSRTELEAWALDPNFRSQTTEEVQQLALKYCAN